MTYIVNTILTSSVPQMFSLSTEGSLDLSVGRPG